MASNRNSTIIDVAKLAGVSASTVSVVINNKDKYVAPELKEKVYDAIAKLNYSPNFIARSLKNQETNTIGLILSNITSPVTPAVVRTVQKIASEQHIDILIVSTEENKLTEKNAVNNFISKRVEGLIICPVLSENYDHLILAKNQANIPIIAIERTLPPELEIPCVSTNNYEICRAAVRHLIEHGRKRIGLIVMPVFGSNTSERIRGYQDILQEHHLYDPELIRETDYLGSDAYDVAYELFQSQNIDAVLCISQSISFGAYKAALKLGRKIPQDIAIIGYDTMDWMDIVPVPLTTVKQPLTEIAEMAIDLIFMKKRNPKMIIQSVIIPSQLVIRQSCGCAGGSKRRTLKTIPQK